MYATKNLASRNAATLALTLLMSFSTVAKAEQGIDVLTIHSVTAIAITDALDDTSRNLIYASGFTLMALAKFGTPESATGVAFSLAKLAYAGGTGDLAAGGDAALILANLINIITNQQDDLIVYIEDPFLRRVLPAAGVDEKYLPIYQGTTRNLNLKITKPADAPVTLSIWEYDVLDPSDYLGDVTFRNGYTEFNNRIYIPSVKEGSVYSVQYSYEKDTGKHADMNAYYQVTTPAPFPVTLSAGANGRLLDIKYDAVASELVTPNTTTTFRVYPNQWYRAEMGGTCRGNLANSLYTTKPITAACTVIASFVEIDTDGDGVTDRNDAFPNDPAETKDTDGDGVGDVGDVFPNDPTESKDSDGDGVGDVGDAFPNDPTETKDTDGDGIGDVGDAFPRAVTTLIAAGGGDHTVSVSTVPVAGSSCSLTTASAEPVGSPPRGFLLGVGSQVSFTLTGCKEGEAVAITVDFGEPLPDRAVAVKVDAGTWTAIGAFFAGSTVTYTVVDNGKHDTNPVAGSISDPVTVASTPPPIPVMPWSLLALLVALLSYLGVRKLGPYARRNT